MRTFCQDKRAQFPDSENGMNGWDRIHHKTAFMPLNLPMQISVPITLTKGANVRLKDLGAELSSLTVLLRVADLEDSAVELDISVLLLQADGRVRTSEDFIFYNQPVGAGGAVHLRDRMRDANRGVSVDQISLNLDLLPPEVTRVLVVGSLPEGNETSFDVLDEVVATLQDSSAADDLVIFPVTAGGGERALIFGEFYLRDSQWRFRAVAQGYEEGLAALVSAYGVEVTDEGEEEVQPGPTTDPIPLDDEVTPAVERADDSQTGSFLLDDSNSDAVSVRRATRPPRLVRDWNRTVPEAGTSDMQPARLFPVAGIGTKDEQERRATSILLALLPLVREFAYHLVKPMGAPSGSVETFVEVPFGHDGQTYRPDGLVRVTRGKRVWQALVEVKTSHAPLDSSQISAYVDIAKAKGIDAVITVTNHIAADDGDHPAAIDRRKLKKVALHHVSWSEITVAADLLASTAQLDATKKHLLEEFVRYAEHERSGLSGFTDMGSKWPSLRDAVKDQTMRPSDRGVQGIVDKFDEMMRQTALDLSRSLQAPVRSVSPGATRDQSSRLQQLSDSGVLYGSLTVPGAVDRIVVSLDVRSDKVTTSMDVPAPRGGRPQTRVNWLLRQLAEAPRETRVEAGGSANAGRSWTAETLNTLREDPSRLLPPDGREIRRFTVSCSRSAGTKRAASSKTLPPLVTALVHEFYRDIVQGMRPPRE